MLVPLLRLTAGAGGLLGFRRLRPDFATETRRDRNTNRPDAFMSQRKEVRGNTFIQTDDST